MAAVPLAILGGSVISGLTGLFGSHSAAAAQEQGAKNAASEQRRLLGTQLGLLEPQRYLGYQAMGDLSSLYGYAQAPFASASQLNQPTLDASAIIAALHRGVPLDQISSLGRLGTLNPQEIAKLTGAGLTAQQIQQLAAVPGSVGGIGGAGGGTAAGAPSLARFWTSPDYNFRFNEGNRGVQQSAAAAGGLYSGNTGKALTNYGQGVASQEFGNYFNRLTTLAGLGSAATSQAGSAVGGAAPNLANLSVAQGDARASGIMGGINALTGSANQGLNLWAYLQSMGALGGGGGGGGGDIFTPWGGGK